MTNDTTQWRVYCFDICVRAHEAQDWSKSMWSFELSKECERWAFSSERHETDKLGLDPREQGNEWKKRQWHYKIWDMHHCVEARLLRKAILYRKWIKPEKKGVYKRSSQNTKIWICANGESFLSKFQKFGKCRNLAVVVWVNDRHWTRLLKTGQIVAANNRAFWSEHCTCVQWLTADKQCKLII